MSNKKIGWLVILMLAFPILIAAVTSTPSLIQTPQLMVIQLPTAGMTPQALGPTPGADGTKCNGIFATSTDSTRTNTVQLTVGRGGTNYLINTVSVLASSGNTAAAVPTNLISSTVLPGLPVDSDGNPYIFLKSGDQLQANVLLAPTPAAVTIVAICGNF